MYNKEGGTRVGVGGTAVHNQEEAQVYEEEERGQEVRGHEEA